MLDVLVFFHIRLRRLRIGVEAFLNSALAALLQLAVFEALCAHMKIVLHVLLLFHFRLRHLRIGVEAFLNSALAALLQPALFEALCAQVMIMTNVISFRD